MRFPDKDKLRRARNFLKDKDYTLLELADVYENEFGGKVLGRDFYEKNLEKPYMCKKCGHKHNPGTKIYENHK